MTATQGDWQLKLFAKVSDAALPASVYFQVLDGTNVIATGSSTTINKTVGEFITAVATVPGRSTYTTSLVINLFATVPATNTLTISVNDHPFASFLNTTIQLGAAAVTSLTVTSLNAGSGAITTTGTLSAGATTVTSLGAGSGTITTTGTLSAGAATVTSLNAGSGTITTTGGLSARTSNTLNNLSINNGTCTGVDFIATSDRRVKNDIQTISNALDIVNGLRGVYFTRIGQTKQAVGVIAQEIEPLLPQVVYTDSEGLKSVSYGNMVGVLIEAVKALSDRLEKIENKE
jgi:hypothetical protein